MKMDLDCIREILLTIENYDKPMQMFPQDFCRLIPKYDCNQIIYCCKKLYEGNYLNLFFFNMNGLLIPEPEIQLICDLTFQGHEFLSNIKADSNWNKTKEVASKAGSFSLDMIKSISTQVISQIVKSYL
ncbi:DUF2513 domain-containing protein [Clostridium botulinum]|nr:DUF2513 domain-containing protein [Clostridium botulinum]NFO68223.1 DUF2513 domain-containing protein [Clostridium botulinum]